MKISDIQNIPLLPKKYRLISIWVISIVFFIFIYMIQISSTLSMLEKSKDEEITLKTQFSSAIEKQIGMEKQLVNFEPVKKEYAFWDAMINKSPSVLEQINTILKLANKNSLKLSNFDPGDGVMADSYFKVPIDININGTYHHFAKFISDIANLPSIIVVSNFTINNNAKTNDDKNLTTDLHLEIYTRPEAENNAN